MFREQESPTETHKIISRRVCQAMCDDRILFSVKEVFEELGKGEDNIQKEWEQRDFIFCELFEDEQEALKDLEQ